MLDNWPLRRITNLIASMQRAALDQGLARFPHDLGYEQLFDSMILDDGLREVARRLFVDGHYALSVEEAFKYINNVVKTRSGLSQDGAGLMKAALSPTNPRLRLNSLKTKSEQDQQLGYMEILSGCMTGIRNPRAHEHQYLDKPEVALEMLVLANHLLRMLTQARRVRHERKKGVSP